MKSTTVKTSIACAVSLATAILYLPALQGEFVEWDDGQYVRDNFHIRALNLTFLKWAFSAFYESNWHPLTWISHAADFAVWGLNPMGHHLSNVALHALNTLLVALLAMKLVEAGGSGDGRGGIIAGAVTAFLFGFHPVHVESVAWVSERKDVLCAFFFLLSLLAYSRFAASADSQGVRSIRSFPRPYALSLFCFLLALLSKPMAVSLPAVLFILDAYPFGRIRSWGSALSAAIEKIPFVLLGVGSVVVTLLAQRRGGSMALMDVIPLPTRLLVAGNSLVAYLGKMVFPLKLVPFYPYPYPAEVSLSQPEYSLPILVVIAVTGGAIVSAGKRPFWLAAWAYYLLTLAPVLGIVQVGGQAMADRYTYLPSLGPFLVVGVAAAWGIRNVQDAIRGLGGTLAAAAAGLAVVGILSYLTFVQIGVWRTSFTLWNHVLRHEPTRVPFAYNNRGLAFLYRDEFDRAIADYTRALKLSHGSEGFSTYFNRGVAFLEKGEADLAIEDFNRGLAIHQYYKIYYLRGMAFDRKGMGESAHRDYSRAIEMEPSFVEPYVSLGVLYGRAGSVDLAMEFFDKAIAIDPNHPFAYGNRGFAYGRMGESAKAFRDLNRAAQLDPGNAKIFFNRGGLYLRTGDRANALADFRRACELRDQRACEAAYQLAQGSSK